MAVERDIKKNIYRSWTSQTVATWVIHRLPILSPKEMEPTTSVFTMDLEKGLITSIPGHLSVEEFKTRTKLVMSGGFEGTEGHEAATRDMKESAVITGDKNSLITVMLEPDSYIRERKNREPLIKQRQRAELWSRSGWAEAVILLPEKNPAITDTEHYEKIHAHISPASWCANIENPHKFEITNRMQTEIGIHLVRLFVQTPYVHSSFLASTKTLYPVDVKEELFTYLVDLLKSGLYTNIEGQDPKEVATIMMERLAKGL